MVVISGEKKSTSPKPPVTRDLAGWLPTQAKHPSKVPSPRFGSQIQRIHDPEVLARLANAKRKTNSTESSNKNNCVVHAVHANAEINRDASKYLKIRSRQLTLHWFQDSSMIFFLMAIASSATEA